MFARAIIILTVVAATLASPTRRDVCDTGSLSCCDNIQPTEQSAGTFAGLLNLENISGPVGVTCTPIGILGVASSGTCNTQAACCSQIEGGAVNCSPVNTGL